MSLTLETTHAVREIYRLRYRIKKPREGVCGILWNPEGRVDYIDGQPIYGTLYIHRQKVQKSESSSRFIAIFNLNRLRAFADTGVVRGRQRNIQ